jgi:short-subunit dehydrogenase
MNRAVLITGASSGIGAATARALAERMRLVLVARRRDRLDALVAEIAAGGGRAWAVAADLERPGEPERVVAEAVRLADGIDAVVNNAGVFLTAAVGAIDAAQLERLWRLNVQAPILLAQAAVPHLAARGGGTIVNVTSVAAEATFAGCSAYSASKAALECWSRIAREELRPRRIRIGVIAPGATATAVWPADPPIDRARMCRPEDIAQAIRAMIEAPASASIDRMVVTPPGGAL